LRLPSGAREPAETRVTEDPKSLNPKLPEVKGHDENIAAVLQLLQERWPNCFSIYEGRRRPLKLLIHLDILKELPNGLLTELELTTALRCYVGNRQYLKKIKVGAGRVGLDGSVVGKVTEDEEIHAGTLLGGSSNPMHMGLGDWRRHMHLEEMKLKRQAEEKKT
jgi:sRNA-binding protein